MNKGDFTPQNAFSMLSYLACEKHIEGQDLKYKLGKLDCYIFYSTYISLLTSYLQLSNADNVDIYLMEGIENFTEFLEIEIDTLLDYDLKQYTISRSNFYQNNLKNFATYNFNSKTDYPYFLKCFEIEDPYFEKFEKEETVIDNYFETKLLLLTYALVLDNIKVIDTLYDKINDVSLEYKLTKWQYNKPKLISNPFKFIDELVISPFQESRCNICGNFQLREDLELVPISDSEFGSLLLPVCKPCKNKNISDSGWNNF